MKRFVSILLVIVFVMPAFAQFAIDIHGNDAKLATPIEINKWTGGAIQEMSDRDWFKFEAEARREYNISVLPDTLEGFELSLYDSDGTTQIAWDTQYDREEAQLGFVCESSDTYYVVVEGLYRTGTYSVAVRSFSARIERAISLLNENQSKEALSEFHGLLQTFPNDPEINLYVATLRVIDVVETPDENLTGLLNAFNAKFDLFPSAELIENASQSTEKLSRVAQYASQNLLPVIDSSLTNLKTAIDNMENRILLPSPFPDTAEELVQVNWFEVDKADAQILAGGLLMVKSMIFALNGFDLGVEPKTITDRFLRHRITASEFDTFLTEYPDLFTGKPNIQLLFRATLENWLMATEIVRQGMQTMLERSGPQEAHLFYADPHDIEIATRYLILLDRIITGLLLVTGGDLNGDSTVNYWDLHILQTLRPNDH